MNTLELLDAFPYMSALHPDPELGGREFRKVLCGDYVCVYKGIQSSVFVYRIVNGKTNYLKLLKSKWFKSLYESTVFGL